MLFSKQIADLKAQVATLEGQLNAANGNVEALTTEKQKLQERIDELAAAQEGVITKADHDAALGVLNTKVADLEGKLRASEESVDAKVREKCAAAGVPAVARDPKAVDTPAKPAGSGATPKKKLAALFNEELAAAKK